MAWAAFGLTNLSSAPSPATATPRAAPFASATRFSYSSAVRGFGFLPR